jgi:hypothetical protein
MLTMRVTGGGMAGVESSVKRQAGIRSNRGGTGLTLCGVTYWVSGRSGQAERSAGRSGAGALYRCLGAWKPEKRECCTAKVEVPRVRGTSRQVHGPPDTWQVLQAHTAFCSRHGRSCCLLTLHMYRKGTK